MILIETRLDMRLTDTAILQTLADVGGQRVTLDEIAQKLDCSERTVRRCIVRLVQHGWIRKHGLGCRHSYRYEVLHDQLPHPIRVALTERRAG